MLNIGCNIEQIIDRLEGSLSRPFWRATEYFTGSHSLWKRVVYSVFGVILAALTLPLAIVGETFHFLSYIYYKRPYLFYESSAPIGRNKPHKLLIFNVCMMPGALPVVLGGMRPTSQRIDDVAQLIQQQNADIVCLQEAAFDASMQLVDLLQKHYRYFYYRIGPNPYRMESALFWASKTPLICNPSFIPFQITGMQKGIKRGFFIAELQDFIVITTHLDAHTSYSEIRAKQIEVIIHYIQKHKTIKPIFLMGDLNIEPGDVKAHRLLRENFVNFKEEDVLHPTEKNTTSYKNCPDTPPVWAVLNHILVNCHLESLTVEKVLAFDSNHLSSALSDHHAIILNL